MVDQDALPTELAALRQGHGSVDVSGRRKLRVHGADAVGWLHDLLTADIAGLGPGASRRSLLLSPTGHVRADVQVLRRGDDVLLVQEETQPENIGTVLAPYVLSTDVALHDVTDDLVIVALPGAADPPPVPAFTVTPSCLGRGFDVVGARAAAQDIRTALLDSGYMEVALEAAEAWRIIEGEPRMGMEFDQRSIPAEAGLDDLIDATKGCFLGQESVARVRNLGHPPRVLRHVQGAHLTAGASVLEGDAIVGAVTSATSVEGRYIGFARVVWSAATARLTDTDGHLLDDAATAG